VTLRAGWNHGTSLVPDYEALLAPLVPGIMRDHLGMGANDRLSGGQEISIAYMHAFGTTVEDSQSEFFGVPAKAWAATDSLDLGFGLDF
jgi:long-chain fatty acid transport protein